MSIRTFQEILNNKTYVDKSLLIKKVSEYISTESSYLCLTRPRRFGKTINVNMLAAYYTKGYEIKNSMHERIQETSKNFSYLYDEKEKRWSLPPASDLTYSNSIGGEHAACVNGNGRNPDMKDILEVGKMAGISENKAKRIAGEIEEIISTELTDILNSYR